MIFRPQFILGSIALAASPLLSFGTVTKRRLKHIGFISGVLRNQLKGDWKGALKQAVEFGFTEYEGGVLGDSPESFLTYCKAIGLKPIAGGVRTTQALGDYLNAMLSRSYQ